jgi:D-alanine-D-alanine ligase
VGENLLEVKIRIALLAGGWSREREVSLKSGEAVYRAIDKRRYDVIRYDPRDDLPLLLEAKKDIDLAFILLHGKYGEDGCIQGLMDILNIPFVGSGVLSSAMALNKQVAKRAYKSIGLGVAKDIVLRHGEDFSIEKCVAALGSVTVVKPVSEGSSIGMSVCRNYEELAAGIKKALQYDREVMVEEYIDGTEITCCVLGNQELVTLPLIEIVPDASYRFFDYEAKYTPGATKEICPARLSRTMTEICQSCAKAAHRVLGCSVWSRSDMIIRDENIFLLETNTIPGMTENSLFPLAARAAGFSLSRLLDELITLSLDQTGSAT